VFRTKAPGAGWDGTVNGILQKVTFMFFTLLLKADAMVSLNKKEPFR
jgi:hypothetical protein